MSARPDISGHSRALALVSRTPDVKWKKLRMPQRFEDESWFARYRGWTLYAGRITGHWRVAAHRFVDGGADMHYCQERYPTLEGAQNAGEFFAENGRWPHAETKPTPRPRSPKMRVHR